MSSTKIYTDKGWLNFNYLLDRDNASMVFITGARGVGKTFGALKAMLERDNNFVLLRRTAKEIQAIKQANLNPYAGVNAELGTDIRCFSASADSAIIADTIISEKGKAIPGEQRGFAVALSTFATIRSIGGADTKHIIYDEFIPEAHVRTIKNEADAFLNFYESINRNRELKGDSAVKAVCMANSNSLANPYYIELGIVSKVAEMHRNKQNYSYLQDLKIAIYDLSDSPISQAKKDTFLYKLADSTGSSRFYDMAIKNDYADVVKANIRSQKLSAYKPLVAVGEICIYRHKNPSVGDYPFYVSEHFSGNPPTYGKGSKDIARFARTYSFLPLAELNNSICYENEVVEVLLYRYLGLNEW